jgi:hypothetical protein
VPDEDLVRALEVAGVFGLNLPENSPESVRLSHGSKRIVLFPNAISQLFVPYHLNCTPLVPGPPFFGGVSAASALPGKSSDLTNPGAATAAPAAIVEPTKSRRESDDSESAMHIGASFAGPPPAREDGQNGVETLETLRHGVKCSGKR